MTNHLDLVVALNDRYRIFVPGASDEQRVELTKMAAATANARHLDGLRWGLKEKAGQPGVYSADTLTTESPFEGVDISNGTQGNAPAWMPYGPLDNGRFVYVEAHDYLADTPQEPPQEPPSEPPTGPLPVDLSPVLKRLDALEALIRGLAPAGGYTVTGTLAVPYLGSAKFTGNAEPKR